jgi:lipocalin
MVIQAAASDYAESSVQFGHVSACRQLTCRCAVLLQYLGQWYEAERYFALFEFAGKCVSANYTDIGDGRVSIVNRQMSYL